jgi:predicted PurR-regulated permease PerM
MPGDRTPRAAVIFAAGVLTFTGLWAASISPFTLLSAVFFWGMLCGVPGAFIRVPVLIVLATVCARYPAAGPLAALLSAGDTSKIDE